MIRVPAEPEPLDLDPARTAVIVVDMQNAFASTGGMLELAGMDITGADEVVEVNHRVLAAARAAGIDVVYLQIGYDADQVNAGGPESPNPMKELAMCLMRAQPELRGKVLTYGTWDFEVVDRLKPEPGDLVVHKTRYSGFAGTNLDQLLRARNKRHLIFTGIATNVCVESTLRDAYFLEYWPLLVSDACMQAGPPAMHEATLFNVRTFLGWVTTSESLLGALGSGG
ncbi:MAG: cysteine hydrolase family protein [Thermoleophilia bacterium]